MTPKILIVDDDQDLGFIIKEALLKQNFEVIHASEGTEALNLLKTFIADLMIVDLTMPGMSGWHLTNKIRQLPQYKQTPIIVLSGLLEKDAQPQEFEAANLYMVKPFDIFKLIENVKSLLANRGQ